MKLYALDKTVFIIRGQAAQFLNGLSSNTLDARRNAFLNNHGRIIATFDQKKISDDEFMVVVASSAVEGMMVHLDRFARLNKTTIERTEHHAYFSLQDNVELDLSWSFPQRKGTMIVSKTTLSAQIPDERMNLFRLENNIPLHGIDYPSDILILNVDEHEFVSFSKGCFLGQEPVSKVHHRSKPSWKLVVACEEELSDEQKLEMTSKAQDPKTKKTKIQPSSLAISITEK